MSAVQRSVANPGATTQDTRPTTLTLVGVSAWFVCSLFYLYQYAVRSALPVMRGEMSATWGGGDVIGHMISNYYVVYSFVALASGALLDLFGARKTMPYAVGIVAVCCYLLSTGSEPLGSFAFVAQAAGAVFAFIGSVYVAGKYIPAKNLSFFVGCSQMLGMAGAAFGTKPVNAAIDPKSGHPLPWQSVWLFMAVCGAILAVVMWFVLPRDRAPDAKTKPPFTIMTLIRPYEIVFENAQTYLCGLIGGLLFAPTTIGALVWATEFLHEGRSLSIGEATTAASLVPIGWIIGCPLAGFVSDKIGRRKPVLLAGAVIILLSLIAAIYVPAGFALRYTIALALGIASGAAMIPFTIVKEVNPDQVKGSASGAMNFLCFMVTGLLAPNFEKMLRPAVGHADSLSAFQHGLTPLIYGVAVAIVLAMFLRETGSAATHPNTGAATPSAQAVPAMPL